jgi:hypothetical protein
MFSGSMLVDGFMVLGLRGVEVLQETKTNGTRSRSAIFMVAMGCKAGAIRIGAGFP